MGQSKVPEFLVEKLKKQYGEDVAGRILDGYEKKRPVTLRVNTLKATPEAVKGRLDEEKVSYQEAAWYPHALLIQGCRENVLKQLDIYEKGQIYLQGFSSMVPPLVLSPAAGESVLDMAAAPGGKTTQMAAMSGNLASITACEKNKIRGERLQYNIDRQGALRVCVMVADARKLDDFFSFDKILLDAPCSGSGTLTLDGNAKGQFTGGLLRRCTGWQEELLRKALRLLKPGHEMVYSTCSVLADENEQILKRVLSKAKAEVVPIDPGRYPGLPLLPVTIPGTLCICPDELYEGFFVAKIRKTGNTP